MPDHDDSTQRGGIVASRAARLRAARRRRRRATASVGLLTGATMLLTGLLAAPMALARELDDDLGATVVVLPGGAITRPRGDQPADERATVALADALEGRTPGFTDRDLALGTPDANGTAGFGPGTGTAAGVGGRGTDRPLPLSSQAPTSVPLVEGGGSDTGGSGSGGVPPPTAFPLARELKPASRGTTADDEGDDGGDRSTVPSSTPTPPMIDTAVRTVTRSAPPSLPLQPAAPRATGPTTGTPT